MLAASVLVPLPVVPVLPAGDMAMAGMSATVRETAGVVVVRTVPVDLTNGLESVTFTVRAVLCDAVATTLVTEVHADFAKAVTVAGVARVALGDGLVVVAVATAAVLAAMRLVAIRAVGLMAVVVADITTGVDVTVRAEADTKTVTLGADTAVVGEVVVGACVAADTAAAVVVTVAEVKAVSLGVEAAVDGAVVLNTMLLVGVALVAVAVAAMVVMVVRAVVMIAAVGVAVAVDLDVVVVAAVAVAVGAGACVVVVAGAAATDLGAETVGGVCAPGVVAVGRAVVLVCVTVVIAAVPTKRLGIVVLSRVAQGADDRR